MIRTESNVEMGSYFIELKQRLVAMATNGYKARPRVLAVTSCGKDEGVTTVAVNLAMTLNEDEHQRVLLVDANMANPALHRFFKQDKTAPPSTEIMGIKPKTQVFRVNEKMAVIFAGVPHEPHHWPANDIKALYESLRVNYSFTIIDCAPLSSRDNAFTLATEADGVILVIEAERTRREVVQQHVQCLQRAGAIIMGTVLNKRRYPIPSYLYNRI